jgi:type II secretory pathway component GspD/PulD (secretin)
MADNFINLRLEGILSVFTQPSTEMNTEHIVNATQIESSVSVKDGATLIVGGLIKSESSKATRKVPVLGSIPLLGVPFKRTYNLKNIIETVIYITPHLYPVDDYESITSWTEVERILNNIKSDIDRSIRILNRTK